MAAPLPRIEKPMLNWNQLEPRDQRILLIGSSVLSAILLYFFLWQPFVTEHARLSSQVREQHASYQWMLGAVKEIKALQAQSGAATPSHNGVSLLAVVDQSLRNTALNSANKRIEPSGDTQVRVDFTAVAFNDLMQWLTLLHNQHQVQISSLNLERLSAGQVKASVRLERAS